jgi:hypothetical protein
MPILLGFSEFRSRSLFSSCCCTTKSRNEVLELRRTDLYPRGAW